MTMMLALLATTALADATPAASTSGILQPVGGWVVEAEESMCLLTHDYGPADARITIAFQPLFDPGGAMEVLVRSASEQPGRTGGRAKVTTDPGETFEGRYYSMKAPDKALRYTRLTLPARLFDQLATARTVHIDAPPLAATVAIGPSVKARAAFRSCQDELLTAWGIDPATFRTGPQAKLKSSIAVLFDPKYYPTNAMDQGSTGRVVSLLNVGADGRVAACRIMTSATPRLNARTCEQARKAQFEPARDAAGTAVPSIYILRIAWQLN